MAISILFLGMIKRRLDHFFRKSFYWKTIFLLEDYFFDVGIETRMGSGAFSNFEIEIWILKRKLVVSACILKMFEDFRKKRIVLKIDHFIFKIQYPEDLWMKKVIRFFLGPFFCLYCGRIFKCWLMLTFFRRFFFVFKAFRVKKRISSGRTRWTKLKMTDLEKSMRMDLGKKDLIVDRQNGQRTSPKSVNLGQFFFNPWFYGPK